MRLSRLMLLIGALCGAGVMAQDRKPDGAAADTGTVIRVETRLVLVDVVATDRKGNYVRDLTAGDFRVWEDDKEQAIKSFSLETPDPAHGITPTRYVVLFLDELSFTPNDQIIARKAAAQFVGANAGPDRMMAVADYTGTVRIVQNFTADAEKLRRAVTGARVYVSTAAGETPPPAWRSFSLDAEAASYGTRNELAAIENLARSLARIPGRKSLVWVTTGFELTPFMWSEVKATISECNKANVAVYPIDVRGLVAPNALLVSPAGRTSLVSALWEGGARPFLEMAAFGLAPVAFAMPQQRGGGTGGGTGCACSSQAARKDRLKGGDRLPRARLGARRI